MVLLACGLARAVEVELWENRRDVENGCAHARTYTCTYTMTSVYYFMRLQVRRSLEGRALQFSD